MDYRSRYQQPFTLEEARQLPVPLITEEIARLQNSVTHLRRTQDELQDALAEAPGDPDLEQAFGENEVVIGSQNERISMLRIVLAEKGIVGSAHYDLTPPVPVVSPRPPPQNRQNGLEDEADLTHSATGMANGSGGSDIEGADGSVYL